MKFKPIQATKKGGYSPALTLLKFTWDETYRFGRFSWGRLNNSMRNMTGHAVCNLEWDVDDFNYVAEHYRPHYWMGCEGHETLYRLVIQSNNMTAVHAIEKWLDRQPFIIAGKRIYVGWKGMGLWHPGWSLVEAQDIAEWWEYRKIRVSSIKQDHFVVISDWCDTTKKMRQIGPARLWRVKREILRPLNKAIRNAKAAYEKELEEEHDTLVETLI